MIASKCRSVRRQSAPEAAPQLQELSYIATLSQRGVCISPDRSYNPCIAGRRRTTRFWRFAPHALTIGCAPCPRKPPPSSASPTTGQRPTPSTRSTWNST
ncbi:hypothetical protein KL86PLE_20216 [uncultured Pleomorphomonas sp.]|uniref:Uncharacterized protein n=1 Tax=uncultured Pleomorphomonas sp. TaxID=442121 RepID=A0A212LDH4_9HYPH|nr:hypothetical protein KL86PLE_20216 [uncultured Pleomorphomonas sp.]